MTPDYRAILMEMYRAFNDRDLEGALEHFAPDVAWVDEATGAQRSGRLELGAYWEKAWKETDLRLEPMAIDAAPRETRARVHEFATAPDGTVLANRKIEHVFTFEGVFIASMTVDLAGVDDGDEEEDGWGDGNGGGGGGDD